jgi:CubicO group peptidase (beta-lactamase class C family)
VADARIPLRGSAFVGVAWRVGSSSQSLGVWFCRSGISWHLAFGHAASPDGDGGGHQRAARPSARPTSRPDRAGAGDQWRGVPLTASTATEDTIFDVASLTKPLATATAVIQLYEQGKVAFDDPVQKYLPDFNPSNDPQRANVTVRMLLTHTSGEPGDLDLKDPWRLDGADKAEGIHRYIVMGWTSRGTCCSSPQLG